MRVLRVAVLGLLVGACQPLAPGPVPHVVPKAAPQESPEEAALCLPPMPTHPRLPKPGPLLTEAIDPKNQCEVVEVNLERAVERITNATTPAGELVKRTPWDRKSKPRHLDLVARRFALDPAEVTRLGKDGFVVLSRLHYTRYDDAYLDIHRSQLPIYVTVDSVLHSVFASHDAIVGDLESTMVLPLLSRFLFRMHCDLPTWSKRWPAEIRRDVDVHLAVARRLLGEKVSSTPEVDTLVAAVEQATGVRQIDLYGRPRMIDFTAFRPRGHYTTSPELQRYFRAFAWLSRVELNLVSRGGRSSAPTPDLHETPREAVVGLALAELATRARALDDVRSIDAFVRALVGGGEAASLLDLVALRDGLGFDVGEKSVEETATALRGAIGARFARTVVTDWQPNGAPLPLAAIGTVLPLGVTADLRALARTGAPYVPARKTAKAAEVAYILGHDHAKKYLGTELVAFPTLGTALGEARTRLTEDATVSLHRKWLEAIRGVGEEPKGVVPSFFATDAHRDLRMSSAIAGYGQLRHAHVLLTPETLRMSGCEIPDGWVEPAPATYDALVAYATQGRAMVDALDPGDTRGLGAHFDRLATTLTVLRTIQRHELEGRALTHWEKQFLAMVAEIRPMGYSAVPATSGWYYRLYDHTSTAMRPAHFVADYVTGADVYYLGVSQVRMGLFVVDAGGTPRLMVGPVAAAFETTTGTGVLRLDDDAAAKLPTTAQKAEWQASHVVPAPPPLPVTLEVVTVAGQHDKDGHMVLFALLGADTNVGTVLVQALDHHGQPTKQFPRKVGPGRLLVPLPACEQLRVVLGTQQKTIDCGGQELRQLEADEAGL